MNQAEWLASSDPAAMLKHLAERPGRDRYAGVSDRKLRLFACACWRGTFTSSVDMKHALNGEQMAEGQGVRPDRPETWLTVPSALDAARWAIEKADGVLPAAATALLREVCGNPWRAMAALWAERTYYPADDTSPVTERYPALPWLTPQVLNLAHAAYQERPGRMCGRCGGGGEGYMEYGKVNWPAGGPPKVCPDCRGAGRVDDGSLDPQRLAILADALEESGCTDEVILRHLRGEEPVPNLHLQRGANPLIPLTWREKAAPCVRGCWALDLLLGKE